MPSASSPSSTFGFPTRGDDRFALASHRAHDVRYLLQRWRALARSVGLSLRTIGEHDGFPITALSSGGSEGGFYVSTGIHGDEPGSTEGLYLWARRGGLQDLRERGIPFFLTPCLNPWGLLNNQRFDAAGRDLNRSFGPEWPAPTAAVREAVRGRHFDLGLTLHEDFDAQGLYLYEVRGPQPYWGELLAASVADFLPADARGYIEGRRARGGVIRPQLDAKTRSYLARGVPEALWLRFHGHAKRVFTLETPSEYGLDVRAEAHARLVATAVELAFPRQAEPAPRRPAKTTRSRQRNHARTTATQPAGRGS